MPRIELLSVCFPTISKTTLKKRLAQLNQWSFTTYRKFTEAHAIFAGSDFDIEKAVREALEDIDVLDFSALKELAGLHPILAKRHYHDTGTLRWFDVNLAPAYELPEIAAKYQPDSGTIGQFVLVVPTEGEKDDYVEQLCREAAKKSGHWDLIAGVSKRAWGIVALARELLAIETVRATRSELSGDSVARREVNARASDLQAQLEAELQRAFDGALWYRKHHKPKTYRKIDLYGLASELADRRFDKCPILHNELLNRQKPSGSAVAAQNGLLQRMVLNEGKKRLGIEGFPPEGGLFASLLEATNLYREQGGRWAFAPPDEYDNARLAPLWKAAINLIRNASGTVAVSELYALWRAQPYGVKDGLLPFLAVAFILSQRGKLAVYREGIFRAQFQDIDVDYLTKDASAIQIRWMDLSDIARNLLSGMADVVRDLDEEMALVHLEPIDVARGLVGIYEKLPHWTKRTMRLSANAIKVRELFKRARDPNQFLFDDIPAVAGLQADLSDEEGLRRVIASVREGLEELVSAYPIMMHRLRDTMLAELRVPNNSPQALAELRERAENIRELAGDFHTEAFVGRVSQFDGTDASLEGIASLAASKPPRNWVDPDFDRAVVDIAEMAQKFVRAETFARVKGRPEKRHSMAVVVGINGHPTPLLQEFDIADADRYQVDALIERITMALDEANRSERSIILAALAELSARYILHSEKLEKGRKKPVVHHG